LSGIGTESIRLKATDTADFKPDVSIILPCYNEEAVLVDSVKEIVKTMKGSIYKYELIFIDDCSKDGTRELIKKTCEEVPNARYIFHEKNVGRGGTVKEGLLAARAPIAGYLDIDIEVHSRYIPAMIQAINDGADVVCGHRIYHLKLQYDDLFRGILSFCYRKIVKGQLNVNVKDSEAGYKFFNVETARRVINLSKNDHWFWDTEIIALAGIYGLRISEVPMVFFRRMDKESTVRPIHDSWLYLKEMREFKKVYRRGLVYRSPMLYHFFIWGLFRGNFNNRFKTVSDLIPEGASVVDVCCGDPFLYRKFLKKKNVKYIGLDINPVFIAEANRQGVDVRFFDLEANERLPEADYVVMQGSLYQFIPFQDDVIRKMKAAARKNVIITEVMYSLSGNVNPALRWLGEKMTNPGTGPKPLRFDHAKLDAIMSKHDVITKDSTCGGLEMLYVLNGAND